MHPNPHSGDVMKSSLLALSAAVLLLAPAALEGQGFAVAARGGTLGIGGELALGVTPNIAIRGGFGVLGFTRDASDWWDACGPADIKCTIKLPRKMYTLGLDFYLGGGFRFGGGYLWKADDPSISAKLNEGATIEIGGQPYSASDVAEIQGTVDSKTRSLYGIIGFGKHIKPGVGLFLDLGVAFLGDSPVKLEAIPGDPDLINSPEFQEQLRLEEQNLESELPAWARSYWPILNVGLKVGFPR